MFAKMYQDSDAGPTLDPPGGLETLARIVFGGFLLGTTAFVVKLLIEAWIAR